MRSGTRSPEGGPTASMLAATLATDGDCTMPPKLMWPVSPRCGGPRGFGGGGSPGCGGWGVPPVEGADRDSAASSGCCSEVSGASSELAFCIDSWPQAHSLGAAPVGHPVIVHIPSGKACAKSQNWQSLRATRSSVRRGTHDVHCRASSTTPDLGCDFHDRDGWRDLKLRRQKHEKAQSRGGLMWHLSEARDLGGGGEVLSAAGVVQLLGVRRRCLRPPLPLGSTGGPPSLLLRRLPGWRVAPGAGRCRTAENS